MTGRIIGEASDYCELVDVLRKRVSELNVTLGSIDQVAGFTDTFASHALAVLPNKSVLTPMVLGPLLQTLGLRLAVIEDPERLEKSRRHSGWQERLDAYLRRRRPRNQTVELFIRREAERLLEARQRGEAAA